MGGSSDEIDDQTGEPRENRGALEESAGFNALRYGKIAAVIVGVVAVTGAGVLIYRRLSRRTRAERLRSMLIEALKDLPDSLRELPDEVASRLKNPLPSIKVVVNGKASEEPGTLEEFVRRVAPAVVGTASTAVVKRLRRSSDPDEAHSRPTVPARD
jgi:hypothetical protein